jgi:flagellar biosynthesis/type III secretory pathway chaperone
MDTEKLARLIAQKLQLLELLARLTHAQASLIEEGDMTRLLPVLGAKQKLIVQLQQLEGELNPFRNEDPDTRRWSSPANREACRQNAARCEALLAEIMQIERAGESEMIRRRDAVAEQLQTMHSAHDASAAYAESGAVATSASFLDLSSSQ